MAATHLTLKDLTHAQHKALNAAIDAACKEHGVKFVFDLPEAVRFKITRETMDRFEEENAAAQLAQERARTASKVVTAADIKTYAWGAKRRR